MSTLIIYPLDDSNVEQPFVLDCDEVEISLTFSVQDIQDVTKRRGSFSKTITLPGTTANNQAFSHAYNVQSFVGGFTPNKRVRCSLWNDGIQTFTGALQLLSITKDGSQINYEVGIYSEEVAFFRQINETLLSQTAGVSGFNHTLTASLASGTWTATAGSGYVYGFVDGWGYTDVQPNALNFFNISLLIPFALLTPSFYVKQLVDLIFAQSGYRYQSAFFESARFKKLVIPYAGGPYLQNDISGQNSIITSDVDLPANNEAWALVEDAFYRFPNGITTDLRRYAGIIPFDKLINDPASYWDTSSYYLQNIAFYTSWEVQYQITIANIKPTQQSFFIAVCDRTTGQPINRPLYNIQNGIDFVVVNGSLAPFEQKTFSYEGTIRLRPNQEMDVRIFYIRPTSEEDPFPFVLKKGARITMVCTENPVANLAVDMVKALPPDITQGDLLSDLQKMFNLYFYQSPEDPKLIYIEPFNDFYASGSVDWSLKIDQNDKHLLQMGDPEARKQITFKYRDSGDALGKLYADTFAEGYGSRVWQTENYYAKGEQVIETKCATVIPASFGNGLIIGRTFDIDSDNKPKERANGYRIAQYNYVDIPNSVPWVYLTTLTPDLQQVVSIPFISHIDNPWTPTFDLAFGMPKNLYFKAITDEYLRDYTRNNLFNAYWLNYIRETTSKESLQVELPIILDPVDIYNLDFRKPVYIDGILFRLLEIREYTIGGASKCTAVLRRILNLAAPSLGAVPVKTFFDSANLVLGEMSPQVITPNNID
jgi:hypothetical protein